MIGLVSLILLLTGCGQGDVSEYLDGTNDYQLTDVITSSTDSSDYSRIYTNSSKSLEQVSQELSDWKSPEESSQIVDGKQALIYDENLVVLTSNEEGTQVEVSEDDFVRDNYRPSFFNQLLTLAVLNRFLGVSDWGRLQQSRCSSLTGNGSCYSGYATSGSGYRGPTSPSPFREYSSRGGGPGSGK